MHKIFHPSARFAKLCTHYQYGSSKPGCPHSTSPVTLRTTQNVRIGLNLFSGIENTSARRRDAGKVSASAGRANTK